VLISLDYLDILFITCAFLFQFILILHFSLRKWHFDSAMRFGPFVYAIGFPAAICSIFLLLGGKTWSMWLGGFLYLIWAIFGYTVEYRRKIEWRNPINGSILGPYLVLYMATIMFYWFPLALIWKPLWYYYAVLFAVSTLLNLISHKSHK